MSMILPFQFLMYCWISSIECADYPPYNVQQDGTRTDTKQFVGVVSSFSKCHKLCGCLNHKSAFYQDKIDICRCGDSNVDKSVNCSDCYEMEMTSTGNPEFKTELPLSVLRFEKFTVMIKDYDDSSTYILVTGAETIDLPSSTVDVALSYAGFHSLKIMVDGMPDCSSRPHLIEVLDNVTITSTLDRLLPEGANITCTAEINGNGAWDELEVLYGDSLISIPNPADSFVHTIGFGNARGQKYEGNRDGFHLDMENMATEDCPVKEFLCDIEEIGLIKLLILSSTCLNFCFDKRRCYLNGDIRCSDTPNVFTPNTGGDVYYEAFGGFAEPPPENHVALNLTVKRTVLFNATRKGINVFQIPPELDLLIKKGQFISVVGNNGAKIAAFDRISGFYPYHLVNMFNGYVGSKFNSGWTRTSYRQVAEVKCVHPTEYDISLPGKPAGTYSSTFCLKSNNKKVSCHSQSSTVLESLKNPKVSLSKKSCYPGEKITATISADSNLEGNWFFYKYHGTQDGFQETGETSLMMQFFNTGVYNVYVVADNTIATVSTSSEQLHVGCTLGQPGFYESSSRPCGEDVYEAVQILDAILLKIALIGCGTLTINYGFYGEISNYTETVAFKTERFGVLLINTDQFSNMSQEVVFNLSVTNGKEEFTLNKTIKVLTPVANATFIQRVAPSRIDYALLVSSNFPGDDLRHSVDWGDGFSTVYPIINQNPLWHTYGTAGLFNVTVVTSNCLNSEVTRLLQVVQDRVVGCELDVPSTVTGELTKMHISIDEGTDMLVYVEIRDKNGTIIATSPKVENLTIHTNPTIEIENLQGAMGISVLSNPIVVDFDACIGCQNKVNTKFYCFDAVVEKKIEGCQLVIQQQFQGTAKLNHIEVNEIISINVICLPKVGRVKYSYLLEDKSTHESSQSTHLFSYSLPKNCYNLTVVIENPVSLLSTSELICVQVPSEPIIISSMSAPPQTTLNGAKISIVLLSGNKIRCSFFFGQEIPPDVYFIEQERELVVRKMLQPGYYNVIIIFENRLHNITQNITVHIVDEVNKPDVDVSYKCWNGTGYVFHNALSPADNIFIVDTSCVIVFLLSNQKGSNVVNTGNIKEVPHYQVTFINNTAEVNHTWNGIKQAEFAFISANAAGQVSFQIFLQFLLKLTNFTVEIQDPKPSVENKALFFIHLPDGFPKEFIEGLCIQITFGDFVEESFGPCADLPFQEVILPIVHKYARMGKYSACFTVSNSISSIENCIPVNVNGLPCDPPQIKIISPISPTLEESVNISSFRKCMNTTIRFKFQTDCYQGTTFKKKIVILRYDEESYKWIPLEVSLKDEPEELEIIGQNFLYGFYKIMVFGHMYDEAEGKDVPNAENKIVKYFQIRPCDLHVEIDGGNERTEKRYDTIMVDGSRSHDADDKTVPVKCNWFCGRDASFASFSDEILMELPFVYEPVINKQVDETMFEEKGCFALSKPGLLHDKGHTGAVLQLNTEFMWFGCHYIVLRIHVEGDKFKRVSYQSFKLCLTEKEPVNVVIKCTFNCKARFNSGTKTGLTTHISNQDICDSVPTYKWQITKYLLKERNKTTDVTIELGNRTLTGFAESSISMLPNVLESGHGYNIQVEVSCDGLVTGAAAFTRDVSTPPDISNARCWVTPTVLQAVTTDSFVECDGVVDRLPVMYKISFQCRKGKTPATLPITRYPPKSGPLRLPIGGEDKTCQFEVIVENDDGITAGPITNEFLLVEVTDPPFLPNVAAQVADPSELNVHDETYVCQLIQTDAVAHSDHQLTNLVNIVNEMMDTFSMQSQSTCQQILDATVNGVVIDSPAAAQTVVATVHINGDLESGLSSLSNVVAILDNLNPEDLMSIGTSLLQKTTEITAGLSASTSENVADAVDAAMKLEATITASITSTMVLGEKPFVLNTPAGTLQMQIIPNGPTIVAGFDLPNIEGGGGGAVSFNGANRYSFDKSSAGAIHGNVQGLNVLDSNGNSLLVANLSIPVSFVIRNVDIMPFPKNYSAYCQLLRDIHRVHVIVNASVIILTVKPMEDSFTGRFFLFGNKGTAPSLIDHQHNCTLPRPRPKKWDTMTEAQQDHWRKEKEWTCYLSESALERKAIGLWCFGVLVQHNGTNITDHLLPLGSSPEDDNCTQKVKYFVSAFTRACLYWDKQLRTWNDEGCQAVEEETDSSQTKCLSTHLTDFGGGGPFADAEPLDLGATLKNINLADNPTVFSVVMALFALYLILLLWARKKDKIDIEKNKVVPLVNNHRDDQYLFKISVKTGFKSGCSTTADVVVVLTGSEGESNPRRLHSPSRHCFQKGEEDHFLLALPKTIGEIKEIDIWHNNSGDSPGWYLLQVMVHDLQTEKRTEFLCNRWLDVAEDDGMIVRKLKPANPEDLTEFGFLFALTARKNLFDGHIWLSVFTRPAASTYTRCQRLATCMSLLFTTLISNAMFYRGDTGIPSPTVTIGPLTVSVDEIKIAFTVALIVIPCNILIVTLFKKAGPKQKEQDQNNLRTKYAVMENLLFSQDKPANVTNDVEDSSKKNKSSDENYNSVVRFFRSVFIAGAEDDQEERIRKKKEPLPYWLTYIAFGLAMVTTLVSAFFVIMYGFAFGKVKSDKWIISVLLSFSYSVLLIQPVKAIALSILFAALLKQPVGKDEETSEVEGSGEKDDESADEEVLTSRKKDMHRFKLPDERRLQMARLARFKEKRIKLIIKEVVVHLMFVLLVIVTCYASRNPSEFRLHESIHIQSADNGIVNNYHDGVAYARSDKNRVVLTAKEITKREEWWDWVRYSVVDYLFPDGWYDEAKTPYPPSFVADAASSKVLAMARFRQLRVTPNSCTKHPVFEHLIVECNAGYSWNSEDDRDFRAGWLPAYNISERWRRRRGKRKAMWKGLEDPWLHQISIGPNRAIAKRIIKEMKKNMWVDRYTRALFTEINIYNANTNLMLVVTFLHEVLPTGGWSFFSNMQAIRLYRYIGGLGDLTMLFDIIFIVVTAIGVYKAIKAIRRNGAEKYFKNVWNVLHIVVTACSICAVVFTLVRILAVKLAVEQYIDEPELFVSFQYVGALEYLIVGSLGFVLFFTNLEFIRILRFNHLIAMLSKTIAILGMPLASFGMIFMVVFMAYVSFAHCIYVDKLEEFHSVMSSFVSLTKMFLGKFDVHAYFDNAPVFGPLMFASYMLSIQMILINLFVGLICDAFAEVDESDGVDEEPSVLGFMADRVKGISGAAPSGPEPIYSDWKDDWDQMMEDFNDCCDNCIYLMRTIEGEEFRQNKFFDPYIADDKKKDLLVAVLGLDMFTYEGEFCDGLVTIERRLAKMTPEEARAALNRAAFLRQEFL